MMKKFFYSLFLLVFLMFQSCQESGSVTEDQTDGDFIQVRFDLNLQAEEVARTRGANPNELHVFLFNGKGQAIEHQELLNWRNDSWIRLPRLDDSAIIHFVWVEKGFQEDIDRQFTAEEFVGMHEGEAINAISSKRELFWARVEIPSLLNDVHLGQIALLRNTVRVSVENMTDKKNKFNLLGFTIHNRPVNGSLAPFNCENGKFEQGIITEAYPQDRIPLAPMDANDNLLVAESDVQFTSATNSIDLFERKKAEQDDEIFLIIKATYKKKHYYYKLGIYDSEKLIRIGLVRNHHYVIKITKVEQAGYTSLQDAIRNAPAENAGLSILLEEYTQISDGKSSLTVSSTALSFHQPNEPMELNYSYIDKSSSRELVPQIELIQVDGKEVIQPSSFSYTYNFNRSKKEHSGVITGIALDKLPLKQTNTGIIRVRVGDLVRDVRIDLGPKKELNARLISFGDNVDDKVYIEFTINKNDILNNTIFPLNFHIDTQYLYPDADSGYNSNLSILYDGNHHQYQYTAREVGLHRICFKRNLSSKSEVIRVKSNHYRTQNLNLSGSDGCEPSIANGEIYVGNNQYEKLDKNANVWIDPEDMPHSFWLPKTGEYSLQFDKKRVSSGDQVSLFAQIKDGRSYKATYSFAHFTGNNPTVILKPFIITSFVYAYYGIDSGQKLDIRAYSLTCSNEGISLKRNTVDIHTINALDVSVASDIPDDEQLIIYASYNGGGWNSRLYKAETTAKKMRRGQALEFTYMR